MEHITLEVHGFHIDEKLKDYLKSEFSVENLEYQNPPIGLAPELQQFSLNFIVGTLVSGLVYDLVKFFIQKSHNYISKKEDRLIVSFSDDDFNEIKLKIFKGVIFYNGKKLSFEELRNEMGWSND